VDVLVAAFRTMKIPLGEKIAWYSLKAVRGRSPPRASPQSERPGRPRSSDAGRAPVASRIAGKTSTSMAFVRTTFPAGTSGPATMRGTATALSYMALFRQRPCSPSISPWSVE
jgi:hypothetical protein